VGVTHHEFESMFAQLHSKLVELDHLPTVSELDQICIRNVKNPAMLPLKTQLILDTNKVYLPAIPRAYDYRQFRLDALTIANSSSELDNWGLTARNMALYASGGAKKEPFTGCWRCGGDHQVSTCSAKVCIKCGAKLVDGVRHQARECLNGGDSGKRFSQGGDKAKGKGGKDFGGQGKKPDSKKEETSVATSSLPDPSTIKSKYLKSFIAVASAEIAKRAESGKAAGSGSKKRRAEDDWTAGHDGTG
jgi:hypothetical protein